MELFKKILEPLVSQHSKIALFDFSNHGNVGDTAIWLGTMRYLQTNHSSLDIICINDIKSIATCDWPKLPESCIILIHGGGNFGDIWPAHQHHRIALLKQYPSNRIIQMPQSIHFTTESELSHETWKVMAQHKSFHLLVRDQRSFEIAKAKIPNKVSLCPDMAHCLRLQPSSIPVKHDVLGIMRTDKERSIQPDSQQLPSTDWLSEPRYPEARILRWLQKARRLLGSSVVSHKIDLSLYNSLAARRLKRGIDLICSASVIITDRLHVHLLYTLLGRPHIVLDNNYGKISAYRAAWTQLTASAEDADTFEPALISALQLKINR